jgi:hypothetical protein
LAGFVSSFPPAACWSGGVSLCVVSEPNGDNG